MEARIRQLEQLLGSAVVGEVAGTSGVAGPGTVVVVDIAGDEETYASAAARRRSTAWTCSASSRPSARRSRAARSATSSATSPRPAASCR